MGVAQDERRLLTELFAEVGPDAPTLCDPWRTRDLAAHLVLRERRPDAAAGILLKPLAGHTRRVQDAYAARPWDELVELVRVGPPRLSPQALADELVNAVEFFVHHEDVRRARDGWEPRSPDPVRDAVLWRRLAPTARLMYRKSPVGVVLRRPDGEAVVARRGANPVVLTGQVSELLVHVFGRSAARVEYDGEEDAVRLVRGLDRSM
ncbi:TIGR03085 family metal-binding protein [Actinosynnema sp. NPDC059335]|uniref:TIGR03085 family metal-binding protein n=1 Tax=Actinosynnema sp. NPDC059335 TaxID=3346804 RepID=UPI003671905F